MIKNILYLTKYNLSKENGLLFPSEIDDENYYSIGGFYIYDNFLGLSYTIQAIYNETIINIELSLLNRNVYICNVNNLGVFKFFIEKLYKPIKYIGKDIRYKDLYINYRLRLINTKKAEYYAKKYNFYFIGNE